MRRTARLLLRRPVEADLARFFAIHGDPAANLFNPAGPWRTLEQADATLSAVLAHWRQHGYGQWAVAALDNPGHVIGFGGLSLRPYLDVQRINLGYRFDPAAWGAGYATELAAAARDVGLDELALGSLYALVRPRHQASIRVLEKIGMRQVDLLDDVPGEAPSLVFRIDAAQCG